MEKAVVIFNRLSLLFHFVLAFGIAPRKKGIKSGINCYCYKETGTVVMVIRDLGWGGGGVENAC